MWSPTHRIRTFTWRGRAWTHAYIQRCPQAGMLTWPIRIVDWKWNGVFSVTSDCAMPCYLKVFDKGWGEWGVAPSKQFPGLVFPTHNWILWGQLECRHVPRPFLPVTVCGVTNAWGSTVMRFLINFAVYTKWDLSLQVLPKPENPMTAAISSSSLISDSQSTTSHSHSRSLVPDWAPSMGTRLQLGVSRTKS